MQNNKALNAPIAYISACNADYSVFEGIKMTDNKIITMTQLLTNSSLGLAAAYIQSVTDNQAFYQKSVSGSKMSMISMIKGKIKILSNSQIYRQPDFIASFESEVIVQDSEIYDIDLEASHIVFHLLSSRFSMSGTTIENIDCIT